VTWVRLGGNYLYTKTTTNLFAADKYISIIDIDINYTAAGCQGAIQLSMLAACNCNNNVLSWRDTQKKTQKKTDRSINTRNYTSA